ncbi:MAG: hypothetical protein H6733_13565 [Alphaproteobacteria bacterium]|nr:hypothetical protein [Alphaproteobacteria bacterium]
MRTILSIAPWLVWAGCTCSSPPAGTDDGTAAQDGTTERKDKKARKRHDNAPVLKQATFTVPVASLEEGDAEPLRAAVHAAATVADPEGGPVEDDAVSPWKCRLARTYVLDGEGSAPLRMTMFQRYTATACEGDVEKWWVELESVTTDRPENRHDIGRFTFDVASEDHDWNGTAWDVTFHASYSADGATGDGPFDKDDAWVAALLPEGLTVVRTTEATSERWALARVDVAGEKLLMEADRWHCVGGDDVGDVLRFRTNRRAAGHTANKPKDVIVINKVDAFADAVVQGLGERVGGAGITPAGVAACGTE